MRIVIANRYFYPDQSATSRMVSGLAFQLARRGHTVHAVASRRHHNRTDIVLPASETVNGVHIHRVAGSAFGRGKLIGRAIDYLSFHASAAWWMLTATRSGDVCVLCTDPPMLSATARLPIALRGGIPVNWVMDLFPETAIELGMFSRFPRLAAFAQRLRNRAHRKSGLTICPTGSMARYLVACGEDKTAIVHHWSDGNEIRPVDRAENPLRRSWGLGERFVVGYSGNFGRAHEFATLLDAAERLRDEPNIRFLLIGEGQQRRHVEDEVARRNLTNVELQPFQPSEALPFSLSLPDVHIVSLLPALEHCVIPSKFYGVLAAGRPTIFVGAQDGEVATVVGRHGCGESVEPGDVDGLVASITGMANDPARCAAMGHAARRLFESEYTMPIGVDAWLAAVSGLASEATPVLAPGRRATAT
ncbi:glycosyltransferase family 4 protein [Neoaquamicrobium microcysteis]|nr:glycosyltransferase family 4 protein [Mesorhizobium microcysteis]